MDRSDRAVQFEKGITERNQSVPDSPPCAVRSLAVLAVPRRLITPSRLCKTEFQNRTFSRHTEHTNPVSILSFLESEFLHMGRTVGINNVKSLVSGTRWQQPPATYRWTVS